ncbi:MAG: HXXEE domain-containing protein [Deltaproteobacteria bacterium]|nr:HXXEE domain-containing protein [Deltaproteobacteria bacterium]
MDNELKRVFIMETSFPWFFWLFPIVLTIHNIEEALWLPAFSKSAARYHKPVETFEFVFALIVITFLAVSITFWFSGSGKQSLACYLFFAFNLMMLINVFAPHLLATVALKKYCPGLLTGILLLVPTTTYLLVYGYQKEYYLFPRFWVVTIPFAAVVVGAIPILFKVGKYVQNLLNPNINRHAAP